MVNRTDYEAEAVEAARSVMLELTRLLGEYREHIVLIGGWVPELLMPGAEPKHIGSLDVDIALDHRRFAESGYRTIHELLIARDYMRDDDQPFIYRKRVAVGDRNVTVKVDLLAGEYEGTHAGHRTQRVQDARPRKARGCDLAFQLATEVRLAGKLPDGAADTATIRVASIVPFLVMKGMAIANRLVEKDAYDVHFCLTNFPGGIVALAREFAPHIRHGLVREGLEKIAEKFSSPGAFGPTAVAAFNEVVDREERDRIRRDVFERVAEFLRQVEARGAEEG